MRKQVIDWEKVFAKDITDIGLLNKLCKDHFKLNNVKMNDPTKERAKDLDTSPNKVTQIVNKHMKRCSS